MRDLKMIYFSLIRMDNKINLTTKWGSGKEGLWGNGRTHISSVRPFVLTNWIYLNIWIALAMLKCILFIDSIKKYHKLKPNSKYQQFRCGLEKAVVSSCLIDHRDTYIHYKHDKLMNALSKCMALKTFWRPGGL